MNADEIVKELRDMATYNCGFEQQSDTAKDAADLIESLQAVGSANYWKSAWETQCAENKKLYEALAESQRRERAAVEDLYKACKCSPCNTGICVKKNCAGNRIPCGFEWRGLQEAEKGETE